MPRLYASVSEVTTPLNIMMNASHNNTVSMATVNCVSTTLGIGSQITIDLGYTTDHETIFTGYVKQIEKQVKDNTYTITAYDKMIRAVDYFIASSDPNSPFTRKNISAEFLVRDLLALAGLTNFGYDPTLFIFGNTIPVEVNLVTVHDFCKMIADALTWNMWANEAGQVQFRNRKPFVMGADPGQPGWVTDSDPTVTITDADVLDMTFKMTEKDLRNRVVVYGNNGVHAEVSAVSPYLPDDFYKSVVASFSFIDSSSEATKTANYNLHLLNRLTYGITMTTLGFHDYKARRVYGLNSDQFGLTGNWYCFSCQHNWSRAGYQNTLELRATDIS